MIIVVPLLIGVILGLVFVWIASRKSDFTARDVARGIEQLPGLVGFWVLLAWAGLKRTQQAAAVGVMGLAQGLPLVAVAEQRHRVRASLDILEETRVRIAERAKHEPSMPLLHALGELAVELPVMRAATAHAESQTLSALAEKIALWQERINQSEEALFQFGKLQREVQALLEHALQTATDPDLCQSLEGLAAKLEDDLRAKVSFLRPELTQQMILDLLQARQLLGTCTGAHEEKTNE